jgi:BirA family biotin operon repressor/biotin-[acetyl-CoA-carboxylase] ligase
MAKEINKEIVLQTIEQGLFPGGIHLFSSVDSTNDWVLDELKRGRQAPFVCIADHQSKGRGRRGRHWLSPSAANIYMSLAWHFELSSDRLGLLSLAQGVAVIRALEKIGVNGAWLKWPNDVLVNDEKIAGVLIEISAVRADSCDAVIGIGVNYQMPDNIMPESAMHWTDVVHAAGDLLADRSALVAMLLHEAVGMCRLYQQKAMKIVSDIKHEVEVFNNKPVTVLLENGERLLGTVMGVNELGELRVLVDGGERVFNSADVSIRAVGKPPEKDGSC